jgi:anti-sigma factor RsiW
MKCDCPSETGKIAEILLEYPAGKLDRKETLALEAHLVECGKCREAVETHNAVWNALDTWEPEQPSMDFNRRLWQRLDETRVQPWYTRLASWKPMLPSAVAALVVVAAGLVVQSTFERPSAGSYAVAEHGVSLQSVGASDDVSGTDVERAVTTLDDLQLLQQLNSATASDGANSGRI